MKNVNIQFAPIRLDIDIDRVIEAFSKYRGSQNLTLEQLLPDSFFERRTNYGSLSDFVTASGCDEDEYLGRQRIRFSTFIGTNTEFYDLDDMLKVAATDYFLQRVGLDIYELGAPIVTQEIQ